MSDSDDDEATNDVEAEEEDFSNPKPGSSTKKKTFSRLKRPAQVQMYMTLLA